MNYTLVNSFQLGVILPFKGHLAMSGDIFCCYNWGKERLLLASYG